MMIAQELFLKSLFMTKLFLYSSFNNGTQSLLKQTKKEEIIHQLYFIEQLLCDRCYVRCHGRLKYNQVESLF